MKKTRWQTVDVYSTRQCGADSKTLLLQINENIKEKKRRH
jgi:hypothetical protein